MNILKLTIKKQWFDMILSGEKKEEYREIKTYWANRLLNKEYTHVKLYNGRYLGEDLPWALIQLHGIRRWYGKQHWGAKKHTEYYVLDLGSIIDTGNLK